MLKLRRAEDGFLIMQFYAKLLSHGGSMNCPACGQEMRALLGGIDEWFKCNKCGYMEEPKAKGQKIRVLLRIPQSLLQRVDAIAGQRKRNRFLRAAVAEKIDRLARKKQQQELEEGYKEQAKRFASG